MKKRRNFKKNGRKYLTNKERTLLRMLLKNSRISNTILAKKLKITSQVAGRIRKNLKKEGVIKDYQIELDCYLLGIRAFALVLFDIENSYESEVISQNLVSFYNIITNEASHIALYAFKSLEEAHNYFKLFEEKHPHKVRIINMHIFPLEGLLKHSTEDLFDSVIRGYGKNNPNIPKISRNHSKKKNLELKQLTKTEKKVLQYFVKNSRIPCGQISSELKELKITRSGVNKIKNRLESRNIVKGYALDLDYEKIGINVFAFLFIEKKPGYWELNRDVGRCIETYPNIISCYKLNEYRMHAFLCGFKNLKELENLCYLLECKNSDIIKVKNIYVTTPRGIIKDSFSDLYLSFLG